MIVLNEVEDGWEIETDREILPVFNTRGRFVVLVPRGDLRHDYDSQRLDCYG
jgi:hypothetical protein